MNVTDSILVCSICGEPLNAKGDCLACLLRTGLDESVVEIELSASLVFGDFEVARRQDGSLWGLGHGAMGVTYLAVDKVLRRKVALKVIDVPAAARGSYAVRERFLREACAAAALRHPNVAAVFQFGASPDGSHCYYAMELVEGETLEARVRRDGPLNAKLALEIAIQITRALMAAAAHSLIHRDLKPGNIMLTSGNTATTDLEVKVIDFGLAKAIADAGGEMDLTHGEFVGTPNFASPEQFGSGPVDVRSDIYSLGATLWFALSGKTPFTGRSVEEIRCAQQSDMLPIEQLKAAHVPSRLRSLLKSMLAFEPAARPGVQDLAARLRRCSAQASGVRRTRVALAATFVLILGVSAFFVFHSLRTHPAAAGSALNPAAPEKSIAVLPFENLSRDPDNAFFADGVQDELLTNLARITDLKVISRTSVMQYKSGVARNLRQIARELGVASVLEGSVQRTGNRVRVSAQLLDARNDVHLWAEHYDRPLDDVFAIQSEIAKAIVDQLRARLSPSEKAAIEQPPTADLAAFDLYTHAKTLLLRSLYSGARTKDNLLQAVELLNQAVARDPKFFLVYCRLAFAHDVLYLTSIDHTPTRLASADAAVQTALRLQPDAGEAHLALAQHLYSGYLDYDHAKQELAIAQRKLPNNSEVFELNGFIDRRQGRWDESTRNLEKVLELDPLNFFTLSQISTNYLCLHRYGEGAAVLDRTLAVAPNDVVTRLTRGQIDLHWHADPKPLHTTINAILAEDPTATPTVANIWLNVALCEHDPIAANRALVSLSGDSYRLFYIILSPAFVEGLIARMRGDAPAARAAFTAARAQQEEVVRTQPDYAPALGALGLIDAGLGRKDDALREGRRAVELLPVERDAFGGSDMIQFFSVICAWSGEKELALQQLEILTRIPSSVTYGRLKLHPFWDPLRGDPRFEKIVASLAPK